MSTVQTEHVHVQVTKMVRRPIVFFYDALLICYNIFILFITLKHIPAKNGQERDIGRGRGGRSDQNMRSRRTRRRAKRTRSIRRKSTTRRMIRR